MVEHFPEEEGVPGSSPGPSTTMLQELFQWVKVRERHLSALAMLAGFITDSFFFERVDLWQTHAVFLLYIAVCFVSIPLLHWIEVRASRGMRAPRWRTLLPLATQFALGGLWSGFVIFYGRSAVLGSSWLFLLFLILIFLGSEYFHEYHSRLVFTSTLFFFALYSYAIFAVPVYTGSVGTLTFLESGVAAIAVFALFTVLLRVLAQERFLSDIRHIRIGAAIVFIVMNVFYFTNILPPLPLSTSAAGIYQSVWRVPGAYMATREGDSWLVRYLGFSPTLHVMPGSSVSAYSAVFAPTKVVTTVVHRWRWQDPDSKEWVLKSTIPYQIVGGRDGGYRGYSTVPLSASGRWRVDVETADGRLIARLPFKVEHVASAPLLETVLLK